MLNKLLYFFSFLFNGTQQNNWNWIALHQFSLFIALAIFLLDLILLPMASFLPSESKFDNFIRDWIELDVNEKENVTKIIVKECIISASFAGKYYTKKKFSLFWFNFITLYLLIVSGFLQDFVDMPAICYTRFMCTLKNDLSKLHVTYRSIQTDHGFDGCIV